MKGYGAISSVNVFGFRLNKVKKGGGALKQKPKTNVCYYEFEGKPNNRNKPNIYTS
jgi:hypothetical protein